MKPVLALFVACTCFAQQTAPKKKEPQTVRSFLVWLAQVTGLSATSSGLRGSGDAHEGDVWCEPAEGGARQRLTFEGGYSWPVFSADERTIIALRGGDLWSIPFGGGNPTKLGKTLPGIIGVVGTGPEGIVVLTAVQIGILSPATGAFSPFPVTSQDDHDTIDRLRAPIRSYDEGKLTVSEISGKIVVDRGGSRREVAPENAQLFQPSLSHDRRRLVYVRIDN